MSAMGTVTVRDRAILVVKENSARTRLHIFALSATGVYIGLDEAIRAGDPETYFLSQYKDIVICDYKGPIYAIRPAGADVTLSFFEE